MCATDATPTRTDRESTRSLCSGHRQARGRHRGARGDGGTGPKGAEGGQKGGGRFHRLEGTTHLERRVRGAHRRARMDERVVRDQVRRHVGQLHAAATRRNDRGRSHEQQQHHHHEAPATTPLRRRRATSARGAFGRAAEPSPALHDPCAARPAAVRRQRGAEVLDQSRDGNGLTG
jgi:hypothetical protein